MAKLYETINAGNWNHKGAISPDHQRVCLAVHILSGRPFALNPMELLEPVRDAIRLLFPERFKPGNTIASFNDHPETTVEDVIRVCKVANV